MNTVTIQYSKENLNRPVMVWDMSQPITENVTEYVTEVKEGMTVLAKSYNPFMKCEWYQVQRETIIAYQCVYSSFDYVDAVRFAKFYARKKGLKYEI